MKVFKKFSLLLLTCCIYHIVNSADFLKKAEEFKKNLYNKKNEKEKIALIVYKSFLNKLISNSLKNESLSKIIKNDFIKK